MCGMSKVKVTTSRLVAGIYSVGPADACEPVDLKKYQWSTLGSGFFSCSASFTMLKKVS